MSALVCACPPSRAAQARRAGGSAVNLLFLPQQGKQKMSRWLRLLIIIIGARFRKKVNPDDEIYLNFRVWPTDVDLSIMNNTAMLAVTEFGRWDYMVRTGFLKYARANKLYLPLASISAQFRRPLKRFQKFRLTTKICYWDEQWIYISHRIIRKEKTIAVALAKATLKKGRERIPLEKVVSDLNWEMKAERRPEMVDVFDKGETLFLENCEAA
jgi:acyl-CoA thioesterase FadM